jgi:hypothetical protein
VAHLLGSDVAIALLADNPGSKRLIAELAPAGITISVFTFIEEL